MCESQIGFKFTGNHIHSCPHDHVSVNDKPPYGHALVPHIQWWSHNSVIQQWHSCLSWCKYTVSHLPAMKSSNST